MKSCRLVALFLWSFYAVMVNTRMAAVLVFRAADNKRGLNLRFLDCFESNNYEHGSLKLALFQIGFIISSFCLN